MPQIDRTEFKTLTSSLYPDNTSGQISPADIRAQMDNIADSTSFKTSDQTTPPGPTDDSAGSGGRGAYNEGDIWIDISNDVVYVCIDSTSGAAVWSKISELTGAEIKTAYEGEPDTNAFTDAEKTKLDGIESGATANSGALADLDQVSIAEIDASGTADNTTFLRGDGNWATIGLFDDGTDAEPGIRYAAEPNTGIRRVAANTMAFIINGVRRFTLSATQATLNLPLTGTAVQQAQDDGTDGRLLLAGAFGVGAVAPPALADVDATTTRTGSYFVNGTSTLNNSSLPTDLPGTTGSKFCFMRVERYSANRLAQWVWTANTATNQVWFRFYKSSGWTDWYRTISESGSNSNGDWCLLPDGTQICRGTATATYENLSRIAVTVTYPAAFSAVPQVVTSVENGSVFTNATPDGQDVHTKVANVTATQAKLISHVVASGTPFAPGDTAQMDFIAIGTA